MADDNLEMRMRDVEKFLIEIRAGRKTIILIASAVGGGLMVLAAFWDHLFGGS